VKIEKIEEAYDKAVVAMLNATQCTEEQAEEAVQAIAELVFATINAELTEEEASNATHNH
jgi:hypothetical protein